MKYVTVIFCLLCFCSCEKDSAETNSIFGPCPKERLSANGILVDYWTKEPIEGRRVCIEDKDATDPITYCTETNQLGRYSVSGEFPACFGYAGYNLRINVGENHSRRAMGKDTIGVYHSRNLRYKLIDTSGVPFDRVSYSIENIFHTSNNNSLYPIDTPVHESSGIYIPSETEFIFKFRTDQNPWIIDTVFVSKVDDDFHYELKY